MKDSSHSYSLAMARPRADIERVQTGYRLRPELIRELKYINADTGTPLNVLIEEALADLLVKYGKWPTSDGPGKK